MSSRSSFFTRRRTLLQGSAALSFGALAPVFAQDSKTLRVGFQKGGGLLGVLKAQGRLEHTFGA